MRRSIPASNDRDPGPAHSRNSIARSNIGATSKCTGPPSMRPAGRDRAGHVAGQRERERSNEKADDQGDAADELEASDQIGRDVGKRDPVALERSSLSLMPEELPEREADEYRTRSRADDYRPRADAWSGARESRHDLRHPRI